MKIGIAEFKAKCTQVLREVGVKYRTAEITNRGRVVAVVTPPRTAVKADPKKFLGSLAGTASEVGDIVSQVAEGDWEAEK